MGYIFPHGHEASLEALIGQVVEEVFDQCLVAYLNGP